MSCGNKSSYSTVEENKAAKEITAHVFSFIEWLSTQKEFISYIENNKKLIFKSNHFDPDDRDYLLPDVYTALYYFRYTQESQKFFTLVRQIYEQWTWFRDQYLVNCRYENPVTDEVFAIAAKLFGEQRCTLPIAVPAFVHMKNSLLDLPNDAPWWEYLYRELNDEGVKIGHHKQRLPLHYHYKDFWHGQ